MESKNKGFSLIELLVSIVVLAIIMIPILDNFVMSSRLNKKSRDKQNATMLASNLLEGSKMESKFSSMAEQLLSKDPATYTDLFGEGSNKVEVEEVQPKDDSYETVKDSCIETLADGSKRFKERTDKKYSFSMKGLMYNNRAYDAIVTYDGSAYDEVVKNDGSADGKKENGINRAKVPVLTSIGTKENAVITEGYRRDWAANILFEQYKEWYSNYGGKGSQKTLDEIKKHMQRKVTITVGKNADTFRYIVEAKVEFTLDENVIPITGSIEYEKYRSYHNLLLHSEYESLKGIYFFYTPDLDQLSDSITVKNKVAEEFSIYFIEQEQTTTNYITKMERYQLDLELEGENGLDPHKMTFYNNLGQAKGIVPKIVVKRGGIGYVAGGDLVQTEEDKARLYEVRVTIYKNSSSHSFLKEDILTTITSTKGE